MFYTAFLSEHVILKVPPHSSLVVVV